MKNLLVFGAVIFTALSSSGVSKIGGGKIASSPSQFVMNIPQMFDSTNAREAQQLLLEGPPSTSPSDGFRPQTILVREFSFHLPRLVDVDLAGTQQFFTDNAWTAWEPTEPDCRIGYMKMNNTNITYIATWGHGRGVVISGPRTQQVRKAVVEMADSIEIAEGACGWKR